MPEPAKPAPKVVLLAGVYSFLVLLGYMAIFYSPAGTIAQTVLADTLHLKPQQISLFSILTDIPAYVGFLFGFLRDRVRSKHFGDRAYLLLFGLAAAACYGWMALGFNSLEAFFLANLAQTVAAAGLGAAARGLVATIARWNGMAGRVGGMTVVAGGVIRWLGPTLAGNLQKTSGNAAGFWLSAAFCAPIVLLAFWRPRQLFDVEGLEVKSIPENLGQSIRRLLRHRPLFLPSLAEFLWAFAPGWGTPLFFFLTKDRHLGMDAYGSALGLIGIGVTVGSLAYMAVCNFVSVRILSVWGTVGGVLGAALFYLIRDKDPVSANVFCFLAGVSCGIPLGSYNDLIIRSCPKELEGAAVMVFTSGSLFAADFSDLVGSFLYERGGFLLALAGTALTTGLIIPVLFLIPRSVTDPKEGVQLTDPDPVPVPT
jgi:MFS family permease